MFGNVWTGTVTGDSVGIGVGSFSDRYAFDLPDGDAGNPFFFPGDRLHYYVAAVNESGMTTVPADTVAFFQFGTHGSVRYDEAFTVRGLPSLSATGSQPTILLWADFEGVQGLDTYRSAFIQNGLFEGEHFDVYRTAGAGQAGSNGLGSAPGHGATSAQLAGYECLIYDSQAQSTNQISNGSNSNGNDKSDDLLVLQQWRDQAGDRFAVYFGDNLASGMVTQNNSGFVNGTLGVTVISHDVRPQVDGQQSPQVGPTSALANFVTSFVTLGFYQGSNAFDELEPNAATSTMATHEWLDRNGVPFGASVPGGFWHERTQDVAGTDYRRVDATFPWGFSSMANVMARQGESIRTLFLAEIFAGLSHVTNPGDATGTSPSTRPTLVVSAPSPNPFNPSVRFSIDANMKGLVTLRIYDLKGRVVAIPFAGFAGPGRTVVSWDGTDSDGARVAIGTYLYRVEGFQQQTTGKLSLVK
jgi:hypothetical protein